MFIEHLETVVKDLILPPSGPLLLAMAGALLLRWRRMLGATLLAVGLVGLSLLCMPVVAYHLARAAQHYPALNLGTPTGAQAVVILGGGGQRPYAPEYGGPAAKPYLLEKLAYGAYVARRTGLPILVTGWHVEATAMRDSLQRNFGLTPRWVDQQSYNTFQNARNSVRILRAAGVRRIILVTTAQHMWRASREFVAAGMAVVPAPSGVLGSPDYFSEIRLLGYVPDAESLVRSTAAIYEMLGEPVRVFLAATHLRRQRG